MLKGAGENTVAMYIRSCKGWIFDIILNNHKLKLPYTINVAICTTSQQMYRGGIIP